MAWASCTGALVIGGDYRGLGVVRSLGRRGIPVWVLRDEHQLAATSRYARRSLPWPATSEAEQCGYLLDLAAREGLDGWAIFPTGDETAALVARHHAVLAQWFRLTTPPWETLRYAYDKRLTYRLAGDLGLSYPSTWYPRDRAEVAGLDCAFPVILKPAVRQGLNRFTAAKAWRVDDREMLLARYGEACGLVGADTIMVQELIPGGGDAQLSYAALCAGGQALASVVARRTRQYPMDFGRASTYVETIDQPEVETVARRLLEAFDYTGLVEVEFKRDPRDGRYCLLDVNGRVWGWHTIAWRAGLDFPYLQWQVLQGTSVAVRRAPVGQRWVRLVTDLPTAAREIARRALSPGAYLRTLAPPIEPAIFAADDPAPFLLEVPLMLFLAWQRHATRDPAHPAQHAPVERVDAGSR
jgi:predicted ATP-grasp superfamily ATP-dependent carboligase